MKALAGIILFGAILVACGGGGSSSSGTNVAPVSAPSPPEPIPPDDFPDYVLLDTPEVLSNVTNRLQGLAIDDFFEEAYRITAERDPERIIADGLIDEFQLSAIELTNISDEYYFQTVAIWETIVELLQELDRSALAVDDQVSYDVYLAFLALDIEGAQYRDYQYPASYGFWGWPGDTETFFNRLAPINNAEDAENYLVLLDQFGRRFRQIEDLLDARAAAGVREPFFTFDYSRSLLETVTGQIATSTSYYGAFSSALEMLDSLEQAEKDDLLDRARDIIDERVIPSYKRLEEEMAAMVAQAPAQIGFGQFEGGDEFYRYALRSFTSSDQTPDEIHALGLQELERIHGEMRALFDELGYPQEETLAQLLDRVEMDGGMVNGSEAVAFFENIIAKASAELTTVFSRMPAQQVQVIGGTTGGYYIRGSDDGTRVGAFYAQTNQDLAYATMPTLAYHEAMPGHHMQIALSQELDLPRFRRNSTLTSYVEGWGLYAERLAKDLGWYDLDPYGDLGRLQFEAMRAARLVLDTGIHSRGWTVDEAREFNLENVGDNGSVSRYSVSPGQASAYMTGMLKILELRQRSEEQLGDLYNIADFHDVVVGNGSMPLQILEGLVDTYIAETLASG